MQLADLASVGSFVSGVAVLVSLVYLAFQVRQATHATRSEIHQNILTGWLGVGTLVAAHAQVFAVGVAADEKGFAAMSDADKLTFVTVAMAMFRHYENAFLQSQEGYVRQEDWNAWANHLSMYLSMPGIKFWWGLRRASFSPAFVKYIEALHSPSMPALSDFFSASARTI